MNHRLLCTLGLIVFGILVFAAMPAMAVNAPGFYYVMPSWDQTLPGVTRFIVLTNMSSAAVLDRETGLVWEQSPSPDTFSWDAAQSHCNLLTTGNRIGWHLPTVQELSSLVNPSVASPGPTLPSGHPFSNVQSYFYWSATTTAFSTDTAWGVYFDVGHASLFGKSTATYVWCVRGGHGVDAQ